jgi:hypothetical protein
VTFPERLDGGTHDRLTAFFVDDAEHTVNRLSHSLFRSPARQGLSDWVQESYPTFALCSDDGIANARERQKQPITLFVYRFVCLLASVTHNQPYRILS